jgi:hypothetical protein
MSDEATLLGRFAIVTVTVTRRRSYSTPDSELVGVRRTVGGSRHEASERVSLRSGRSVANGWTLNMSRGGVRVVLEGPVKLGGEYVVTIGPEGDPGSAVHEARIVWLQEEADGQIAGVKFLDCEGAPPDPDESST